MKGVLRCYGRIKDHYAVYIPDSSTYAKKLVQHAHVATLHGGVGLTMAKVWEKSCIPQLRQLGRMQTFPGTSHCYFTTQDVTHWPYWGELSIRGNWSRLHRFFVFQSLCKEGRESVCPSVLLQPHKSTLSRSTNVGISRFHLQSEKIHCQKRSAPKGVIR